MGGTPHRETDKRAADGVLWRSLAVLEALAAMDQPASLMSIAEAANLSKASAYRLLRGLQEQGFVDHTARRGYRIGTRAMALGSLISPRPVMLQRIRPIFLKLAQGAQESAHFHVRSGEHRVCVFAVEPATSPQHRHVPIGERAPLTSGCAGMTILAHLPEGAIDEVLESRFHGDAGAGYAMRASLERIRHDGFAISYGSNHADMHGIASPVVSIESGDVLGSVSILGAAERLPDERLLQLVAPMRAACRELAILLEDVLGASATFTVDRLDVGPGVLYVADAWAWLAGASASRTAQ